MFALTALPFSPAVSQDNPPGTDHVHGRGGWPDQAGALLGSRQAARAPAAPLPGVMGCRCWFFFPDVIIFHCSLFKERKPAQAVTPC